MQDQLAQGDTMQAAKAHTVLVVDDEPLICELMTRELRAKNYTVKAAHSGNEGYNVVREGGIDVVISDVRMPDGTGIDLLKQVKASHPRLPLILMTGYSGITIEEALALGSAAVLVKPFDRKMVLDRLNRVLTPLAQLWGAPASEPLPATKLRASFASREAASAQKSLGLGTQGFAITIQDYNRNNLNVDEVIGFEIAFTTGTPARLKGEGHVRWLRPGAIPVAGIEISRLDPEFLADWCPIFEGLTTTQFVPSL